MKNNFFVRFRILLLIISFFLAIVCTFLIFRVNVNNDMTKYLPDDSPMNKGVQIIMNEFSAASSMQVGQADVRILYKDIDSDKKSQLSQDFLALPEVVSLQTDSSDNYTLFSLMVVKDLDQRAFGEQLRDKYADSVQIVTSQDSAAADATMLAIAVAILLVILFAMCRSWLEPPLFIISTGIAVVLNLGTNALLPSVSVTTHSIAAVLQLVLSMDYSIILANRFRQEKLDNGDAVAAMSNAIRLSTSSILSSAATTVVGMLVLICMSLKIGADLGIVLAKGVVCSLVCNYTVLPALLVMCSKGVDRTRKASLPIPTNKLSFLTDKARIPLSILFVVLLVVSYFYRNSTPIKFSTNQVTEIDKVFPKKNISVILYNNEDSAAVPAIADEFLSDSNVEMFISYPSLLQRQYPCDKMITAVTEMSQLAEGMLDSVELPELTEPMLRLVYYSSHTPDNSQLRLSLRKIYDFLKVESDKPESMMAAYLDNDTKAGLAMLDQLMNPEPTPVVPVKVHHRKKAKKTAPVVVETVAKDSLGIDSVIAAPQAVTHKPRPTNPYEDVDRISEPLTYSQMAAFLNMDEGQAKTIYKMAGYTGGKMAPYDFVHYVADQLFSQKMVSMMVKKSEKKQLNELRDLMDKAMDEYDGGYDSQPELLAAMPVVPDTPLTVVDSVSLALNDSITSATDAQKSSTTKTAKKKSVKSTPKKQSNSAFAKLDLLLDSTKTFTAKEMSAIIADLDFKLDSKMIDLLYLYYGSNNLYSEDWTMSVEDMVTFIGDSIIQDPRFDAFINDTVKQGFSTMQASLVSGLGMMRSDKHALAVVISNYPDESPETYDYIENMQRIADESLTHDHYLVGESNMFSEMRSGFDHEMLIVTILTIFAIFLIVAISFKSLVIPALLVALIMTAVFIDVAVTGLTGNAILYVAYLIVQSILMGATIDYAILFTNLYRENRRVYDIRDSIKRSYVNAINTITTSGLIMIVTPFLLSYTITDMTVSAILYSISIGALASVLLILLILPALLALCDKLIVRKK
ncbi:MAG: MMPL family transporter [Paludibacteraceae bacterium]|nr:MMPL family transporter [Paludibacteraceae bacterium]